MRVDPLHFVSFENGAGELGVFFVRGHEDKVGSILDHK